MIKPLNRLILFTPLILNISLIYLIILASKIKKIHPLTLMLILILLTFIITLQINCTFTSWLPFILFLTIIGGLIIIFIYITRLTNNELFTINLKLILKNILKTLPILLIIIFIYYFNTNRYTIINKQYNWLTNFSYNTSNQNNNINILYINFYNKSTLFLILYLYYSIICIINICSKFKAPLRQTLFYE